MKLPHNKLAGEGHNSDNLFAELGPIEQWPTARLRAYDNSARRHTPKKIVQLGANIRAFGFLVPVLATADGEVIAGHARLEAAKQLELPSVPVIVVDHLTPAQVKAVRLADNKLAEMASWDRGALRLEFEAIVELGEVSIDLTGWETAEIDVILSESDRAAADDPADVMPPREPAISRPGDLWCLGEHRLLCGSSRDRQAWARLMGGRQAAMVFTDPPYGVAVNGHISGSGRHPEFAEGAAGTTDAELAELLTDTIGAAAEQLKDGGIADICMDHPHIAILYAVADVCGLKHLNLCVWNKANGGMGSLYRSKHELVLVTKKGRATHTNNVQLGRYGRYRANVWDYAGANSFGKTRERDLADHPTVKPVALVADAIRDVTHPREIVIDGFMGSGTTIAAAERAKRIGYGIEIDGAYVDVAIRRWQAMTGKEAVLDGTGETLAELKARRATEVEPDTPDLPEPEPSSAPVIRRRARPLAA